MKYTDNNNNLLALVIAGVAIITTAAAIMTPLDAFATQSQSQSQASQGSDQSQRVGVHDNAQQTSGEGDRSYYWNNNRQLFWQGNTA